MLDERTEEQTLEAAQRFYDENLKARLEPEHNGEFVLVNLESAAYTMASSMAGAYKKMQELGEADPNALVYFRVGRPAAIEFSSPR